MNLERLYQEGFLEKIGDQVYMTTNLKTLLTFYNSVNPNATIKLGTLATYSKRHKWKRK